MGEQELLRHIFGRSADLSASFPHVQVGPGDDCAVIASPAGGSLLLKVDQLVEGRHFRAFPVTPLELIARKAIARAVSDIAAMGGTPLCVLAAATLPNPCPWADELFDRMARWARHWNCPLVGGDIASWERDPPRRANSEAEKRRDEVAGAGRLVLSVTVVGAPHAVRGPVLRSTARAGDGVYVSGPLGGSLDAATGLGRHLTFEPRLAESRALCDALGANLHAMMDISDGLGIDAGRLAAASGVRIEIDAATIPRAPGVPDWRRAASDGEDYELLFTAAPSSPPPPFCTRIGRVSAGSGCVIIDGGREIDASGLGWEHSV